MPPTLKQRHGRVPVAGHLGAWGGITLTGALFLMGPNHLGWILFMILPGALIPALLIRVWGAARKINRRPPTGSSPVVEALWQRPPSSV